jgi:hypothetical protein
VVVCEVEVVLVTDTEQIPQTLSHLFLNVPLALNVSKHFG